MAEQYLIEVSEKLALLIKGTRVNGHDKISINSLYKKGDEWMFGRNNVSFPLDEEITKQVLAGIINVSKEDPNTFEVYDTPAKSTEKKTEKKTAKK